MPVLDFIIVRQCEPRIMDQVLGFMFSSILLVCWLFTSVVFPLAAVTTTCWRKEQLGLLLISPALKDYNLFVLSKYRYCNLLATCEWIMMAA